MDPVEFNYLFDKAGGFVDTGDRAIETAEQLIKRHDANAVRSRDQAMDNFGYAECMLDDLEKQSLTKAQRQDITNLRNHIEERKEDITKLFPFFP